MYNIPPHYAYQFNEAEEKYRESLNDYKQTLCDMVCEECDEVVCPYEHGQEDCLKCKNRLEDYDNESIDVRA